MVYGQTWTHALYTLAAKPEWVQALREEVETIVKQEGMTKSAMQKMIKLDSFFRENSRINTFVGGQSSMIIVDWY
jgi:hypothetical protein